MIGIALEVHTKIKCLILPIYLHFSDLYTFDTSVETAKETYELVCEAYCSIFDRLGLNYIKGKSIAVC